MKKTQHNLHFLMDKLINSNENGDHVTRVNLDFSKAFDTVDQNKLFNKLNHRKELLVIMAVYFVQKNWNVEFQRAPFLVRWCFWFT